MSGPEPRSDSTSPSAVPWFKARRDQCQFIKKPNKRKVIYTKIHFITSPSQLSGASNPSKQKPEQTIVSAIYRRHKIKKICSQPNGANNPSSHNKKCKNIFLKWLQTNGFSTIICPEFFPGYANTISEYPTRPFINSKQAVADIILT